jgi:hypothetical protein
VSSFAPDEVFEPRTIHLPFGTHVIFAKAEGYPDAQVTIEVKDKSAQHVTVDLTGKPTTTAPGPMGPTPPLPTKPAAKRGTPFLIAGGAAIAAGIGASAWWKYEYEVLQKANRDGDDKTWQDHSTRYDIAHVSTFVLYGGGIALIAAGVYLRMKSPESPAVAAVPLPEGGAMVSVGWSR